MPGLIICAVLTTNPEVIGHDVTHQCDGVVFVHAPVGPVQRIVCGDYRFLNMGIGRIIGINEFLGRRGDFQK